MAAPKSSEQAPGLNGRRATLGVCLLLVLAVLLVFGQTFRFGFVSYDDDKYVYHNPEVLKGLTLRGIAWAFTYGQIGHWHPLTWLSHMLDAQLFGPGPAGPHLTNVLLHAANAVLLFLWLRRWTGGFWRSAFVAAIFAIHPLRAESVAWVSERKDVLSGLFFMLTLWAYALYAQGLTSDGRQAVGTGPAAVPSPVTRHPSRFYILALLFFALGLMSKSMLVTLPFVLLLLDYWPLGRVTSDKWRVTRFRVPVPQLSSFNHLLLEKLPFFLFSAVSCAATGLVPEKVADVDRFPFLFRIESALDSYVAYLGQMIYPAGLAVPYPFPIHGLPPWEVAGALALLMGISVAAFALRKSRPYLITGWLWYLGMLVPVSGIVQISYYARADRYTYLPQIGVSLMAAWAAGEWAASRRHRRQVLGVAAAGILGALMVCAFIQTSYWRNGMLLWNHALACTSGNYVAHNNLGYELAAHGRWAEAIGQYQRAIEINPNYSEAHYNLGIALAAKGEQEAAVAQYEKAIQINPDDYESHYNLGIELAAQGRTAGAIEQYQRAIETDPDHVGAHNNLGHELAAQGRPVEAIEQFEKALEINPDDAYAHNNLAHELAAQGRPVEAIEQFRKGLQINPRDAEAQDNLADVLAAQGRLDEAIGHYKTAIEINTNYFEAEYNLAIVLASQGRLDEAIGHYERAVGINPGHAGAQNDLGLALARQGRFEPAIEHFEKAVHLKPDDAEAYNNLGNVYVLQGRGDEAIGEYRRAIQLQPDDAEAHYNLGKALLRSGRMDEALEHLKRAVGINPGSADFQYSLGNGLQQTGQPAGALEHFKKALELDPGHVPARLGLAWLLATCPEARLRDGNQAVELAQQAGQLSGGDHPEILDTLAAAYAEAGRFGEAVETAKRALALPAAKTNQPLVQAIQTRLKLYEAGFPFRDAGQASSPAHPDAP